MRKNIKAITGIVLIIISFVAIIAAAIWAVVFNFMHPDMTELRLLIENPCPTIIVIVFMGVYVVGKSLIV